MSEKKSLLNVMEQLFPKSRMRPLIAIQLLDAIRIKGELSRWHKGDTKILEFIAQEHHCSVCNIYHTIEKLLELGLLKTEGTKYVLGDSTIIKQFMDAWEEFLRKGVKLPEGLKSVVAYIEADKNQQEVEA